MTEPAHLEPIQYEPVAGQGWRVPDHERERWDSDIASVHPQAATAKPDAPTLDHILDDLEAIVFLSDALRTLVASSYETNPHQTWQLVENIKRRTGTLENPAGVLVVELRKIT